MIRSLISILLCVAIAFLPRVAECAIVVKGPTLFPAPGGGGFTAYTAGFDGSTNYLTRSGSVAGIDTGDANSKTLTISFWVDFTAGDGAYQGIIIIRTSSNTRMEVYKSNTNKITINGYNSSGTQILGMEGGTSIVAADSWKHILICVDLTNTSNRHIYINGADETLTVGTYTNDFMDLYTSATPNTNIGTTDGVGTNKLRGSIAELWLDDTYLADTTKFASGGHPISLGSTGNTPTGSAPAIYLSLSGSGNSWVTDSSGNGNTYTVNGSALGSPTAP